MKFRKIAILAAVIFSLGIVSTVLGGGIVIEQKTSLRLVIAKTETFAEDKAVMVLLENAGKGSITILKEFAPRPVFFHYNLIKSDGTPVDLPGAGKVDFDRPMKYVTLEPGEFIGIIVSLKDVNKELPHGKYELSVQYHNQYGDNCFRGVLTSNTINMVIDDSASQPASTTNSVFIPKLASTREGERLKLLNQLSKDRSDLQAKLLSQLDESNPTALNLGIAYLLGVYRMDQTVQDLSKYIALKNVQSMDNKRLPLYGEYPVVEALIRIGNPAIPEMLRNIESSDDDNVRKLSARVIRYIDGTEIAQFRLEKRMEAESDQIKKMRLRVAIESIRK